MPPRAVARARQNETAFFAAWTLGQSTQQRAARYTCWWGGASPLNYLASCVFCWSLRCLCEIVQSHGRRSLLCPSTYRLPLFFPEEGSVCVRATKTTATPAPEYNIISSSFDFAHPSPGGSQQQRANPVLAVGRTCLLKISHPK